MLSNKKVPGPGQYNPDFSTIKGAQGGSVFPKGNRLDLSAGKTKSPGPGHVNIVSDWERSVTIAGGWLKIDPSKPSDRGKGMISRENVPGPGAYSAKEDFVAKRGPAYSI